MKRILAFILIICHLNTALFQTQLAEQDKYDMHGKLVDDINSAAEFFSEVVMGNVDETPEDEDEDTGNDYQAVKTVDYYFLSALKVPLAPATHPINHVVSETEHFQLLEVSLDIPYPPPEA